MDIDKKLIELSAKYECNVLPIVFKVPDTDEEVIGFIKEPSRMVKIRAMDKGISSPITAASEVLEAVFLSEESDKRIMDNDDYYLGATMAVFDTIKMSVNQFKKK